MNLLRRLTYEVLRTLDMLFPGWSRSISTATDHGDPLSRESLNYWLTDERCRRGRD